MDKGLLITFIFITPLLHWSFALDLWNDSPCSPYDETCKNSVENEFLDDFRKREPSEFNQHPLMEDTFPRIEDKKTQVPPFLHSNQAVACYCHMENKLIDLGKSYYPRYVHSGICNPNGCGGLYRCIEKPYTLHVLKQKPRNSDRTNVMAIPQNIRDLWEFARVTVTVGCECSP